MPTPGVTGERPQGLPEAHPQAGAVWAQACGCVWMCGRPCDLPRRVTHAACLGQSRSRGWDQRAVGVGRGGRRARVGRSPVAPSRHAGLLGPLGEAPSPPPPAPPGPLPPPRLVPVPWGWAQGLSERKGQGRSCGREGLAVAVRSREPWGRGLPPSLLTWWPGPGGRWGWRSPAEALALARPSGRCVWAAPSAATGWAGPARGGGAYIRRKLFPGLMFDFLLGIIGHPAGRVLWTRSGPACSKGCLSRAC